MADIKMINCHVHTFTLDHVPRNFPNGAVGLFRNSPALVGAIGGLVGWAGAERKAQIMRLERMAATGRKQKQESILKDMMRLYPPGTRFVVLPMDIGSAGYKAPPKSLIQQHDELYEMSQHPVYGDAVIPFATLHPDDPDGFARFKHYIEEKQFRGLKIYPKLGFSPEKDGAHWAVLEEVFEYCQSNSLPVMSHCSDGGVKAKGLSEATAAALGAPHLYKGVLRQFPQLRLCLAHFGGNTAWDAWIKLGLEPDDEAARRKNWLTVILDMLRSGEFPGLFTDISYTLFDFQQNVDFLQVFLRDEKIGQRVLFGSDFYMTRQENSSERAISMRLRARLGEETFQQIAETNPRAWLDPEGKWLDGPP